MRCKTAAGAEVLLGFYAMFSRLTNGCALECGVGFRQLRTCRRTRPGQLCAITGSQLISHFVGAFFPAQASRLYKQEAREVLV